MMNILLVIINIVFEIINIVFETLKVLLQILNFSFAITNNTNKDIQTIFWGFPNIIFIISN